MTQTPARSRFKHLAGNVNHFLITILVGLDAVRDGSAELSPSFSTSWQPHDRARSADRSADFAHAALLAWLVDALDSYAVRLNRKPFLLQDVAQRNAFDGLERSVALRARWLAREFQVERSAEYALTMAAVVWRNRLVHSGANNQLSDDVVDVLQARSEGISAAFQGLDVARMLGSLQGNRTPSFKEITSLVRGVHDFVGLIDEAVLGNLDPDRYFVQEMERYTANNPARVANIWRKDVDRRRSSLRQIAKQSGFSEVSPELGIKVIDELAEMSHKAARDRFL